MSVDDWRLGAYRVTGSDWRSLYLRERAARIDCEVRLRDAAVVVVAPDAAPATATAVDWRAAWERERDARADAEARLSGQRWAMGAVVVAVVALAMLMGCLSGCNEASRAVARWEVGDGRD